VEYRRRADLGRYSCRPQHLFAIAVPGEGDRLSSDRRGIAAYAAIARRQLADCSSRRRFGSSLPSSVASWGWAWISAPSSSQNPWCATSLCRF